LRESKPVDDVTKGGDNPGDPTDQATVESDRALLLRIRDREWKLAGKIQEALDRIEDGTYGTCEECGEEISEKRLMARPVTTSCVDCKTSQEEDEPQQGAYLKR
jgi:DnaK suppressor protein